MTDPTILQLTTLTADEPELFSSISRLSADFVHDLLKPCALILPKEARDVELLATHLRPHLDEYLAMLLFRACLPEAQRNLPLLETVLTDAQDDPLVRESWSKAAVFGLGGVQNGGSKPLLVFDEHTPTGQQHTASSAVALVTHRLLSSNILPKALFFILREADLVDALGGAHPKHLANYLLRLHDLLPVLQNAKADRPDPCLIKRAVAEGALLCLLRAASLDFPYWEEQFWRPRALAQLEAHAASSPFRQQEGFNTAYQQLQSNLARFRQPHFAVKENSQTLLGFPLGRKRLFQSLLVPFIAALCPLVLGEKAGRAIMGRLWDARLVTQMRYSLAFDCLEKTLGPQPEAYDGASAIGHLVFRSLPDKNTAGPWVIAVDQKAGLSCVRQALTSYVRKYHADQALTLLHNPESDSSVLSRGSGISKALWDKLIDWLLDWEGSSDQEGQPGAWHVVTNARGERADFILNGNAAHRYARKTKLDADTLVSWLARQQPAGL
ncbi:MAG: hypothetical protein J5846_09795 [Desulfovibrio sp.]|nr:hypothetical protein [Desulfovibrio sp.]